MSGDRQPTPSHSFKEALAWVEQCHHFELEQLWNQQGGGSQKRSVDPITNGIHVRENDRQKQNEKTCPRLPLPRSPRSPLSMFANAPHAPRGLHATQDEDTSDPNQCSGKTCESTEGSFERVCSIGTNTCSQSGPPLTPRDAGSPNGTVSELPPNRQSVCICDCVTTQKWADLSFAVSDMYSRSTLKPHWSVAFDVFNLRSSEASVGTGAYSNGQATGGMLSLHKSISEFRSRSARSSFDSSVAFRNSFCHGLQPTGKARLSWDCCGLLLCLYDLFILPLLVATLVESNTRVAVATCTYWTCDLGVTFFTGYFSKEGGIELRLKRIAERYLRTWFIVDFGLTSLDWGIIAAGDSLSYGKSMKSVFRLARVMRLLRLVRLAPRLHDQMGRVTSQVVFTFMRLFAYLLIVVFLNHYIACLWCFTWSSHGEDRLSFYRYFTALHWSFAHCVLGSMDIHPTTVGERIMTCCVLIVSLAVFSIILSMITNDALELRSVSADKHEKSMTLLAFFSEHKLPPKLTCRVWRFVQQHKLFDGQGRRNEKAKCALQLLPHHVQQEIMYEWFTPVLQWHPFFQHYSLEEPSAMKYICDEAVTVLNLLPEEHLMWSSEEVQQMVFVEKGILRYHPWGETSSLDIKPGMWACEEALWGATPVLPGQMVARLDACSLFLVCCTGFKEAAYLHRSTLPFVKRYASAFVIAFNDACSRGYETEEALFNDPTTIAEIVNDVINVTRAPVRRITAVLSGRARQPVKEVRSSRGSLFSRATLQSC